MHPTPIPPTDDLDDDDRLIGRILSRREVLLAVAQDGDTYKTTFSIAVQLA